MVDPASDAVVYPAAVTMIAEREAPALRLAPRRRAIALATFAPELAGLGALLAVEAWLLKVWLWIDTRPSSWDPALLLLMTDDWRLFFRFPNRYTLLEAVTFAAWKAPPLWPALMGFVQALVGPLDEDTIVLVSSTLALALLMAATYGIGRLFFGRLAGACAAALATLLTGIVLFTHTYLLDVPFTALVTLAMFGLARLLRPRLGRWDAPLAALLLGLACLTKYQAPFFLWLPALFVLGWRWRAERQQGASAAEARRRTLRLGLTLAAGPAVLLGGFLVGQLPNWRAFAGSMLGILVSTHAAANTSATAWDGPALTWFSLGWYVRSWFEQELLDQAGILALAGLGAVVALVWRRAAAGLLLSWLLGGYVALWFVVNKEGRFDLPYLPVFALLAAAPLAWLGHLRVPPPARWLGGAAAVTLLGGYAISSLAWHGLALSSPLELARLPDSSLQARAAILANADTVPINPYQMVKWPATDNWQQPELLRLLSAARARLGLKQATVAFVPSTEYLLADSYRYAVRRTGEPLVFLSDIWNLDDPNSLAQFFSADFVLAKTNQSAVRWDAFAGLQAFAAALQDPTSPLAQQVDRRFVVFARRPLPDDSEVVLYVRRSDVASFNAVRDLAAAQVSAQDPGFVTSTLVSINGDTRKALFEHPPAGNGATSVTYALPRVPDGAQLQLGVALQPESWTAKGDGVVFQVDVLDGNQTATVFQRYVDPKHVEADRRWIDAQVDLSAYAGRSIRLRFSTSSGPAGDNQSDWAVWGEPVLLPIPPDALERLALP